MISKTTSLELSKQLKEAGARQRLYEYDRFWSPGHDGWEVHVFLDGDLSTIPKYVKSFDCHELLEGLPRRIWVEKLKAFWIYILLFDSETQVSYDWIEPIGKIREKRFDSLRLCEFTDKYLAEALGKLYLWCLQNGHCDA